MARGASLRLVLQPTKTGLRVSGALDREHAGSSPSQRCEFAGEGRGQDVVGGSAYLLPRPKAHCK